MTPTTVLPLVLCCAACYALGASGLVPQTVDRARFITRRALRAGMRRPLTRPLIHVIRETGAAFIVLGQLIEDPRGTVRRLREWRRTSPKHQPPSLPDTVREAVYAHLPADQADQVHSAVFPLYDGCPGLANVPLRDRKGDLVCHVGFGRVDLFTPRANLMRTRAAIEDEFRQLAPSDEIRVVVVRLP